MSPTHADTDVALPHASLLAYFRNPAAAWEPRDSSTSPEADFKGTGTRHFLHTRSRSSGSEDEESKCGFWGERSSFEDDTKSSSGSTPAWGRRTVAKGAAAFCCFWCAFSIIVLGAFGLYFVVDLAFSYYGLGTGMSQWVMYRHQLPSSTSHGMTFCLQTPNREAPGPQRWRYMVPGISADCTTDTIAFIVNPQEAWKVRSNDMLLLWNDLPPQKAHVQPRQNITVEEMIRAYKLGDDLAEEGHLGR